MRDDLARMRAEINLRAHSFALDASVAGVRIYSMTRQPGDASRQVCALLHALSLAEHELKRQEDLHRHGVTLDS
jgi:hypothetical protein